MVYTSLKYWFLLYNSTKIDIHYNLEYASQKLNLYKVRFWWCLYWAQYMDLYLIVFFVKRNPEFLVILYIFYVSPHTVFHFNQVYNKNEVSSYGIGQI
jgi:hypothetical protein